VYVMGMSVDANHDGTIDTSYTGPDQTLRNKPMKFWVNNDQDFSQFASDPGSDLPYGGHNCDDDYINGQRDLEDFARLWISGMPALPSSQGYTVTLSMNASSGNPAVNIFKSVEVDGGISYLTDTNIAAAQIDEGANYPQPQFPTSPGYRFAQVNPSKSFTFPADYFTNNATQHFLFEGAGIGTGQLTLTISQNGVRSW
jgi:hypothetical protein